MLYPKFYMGKILQSVCGQLNERIVVYSNKNLAFFVNLYWGVSLA